MSRNTLILGAVGLMGVLLAPSSACAQHHRDRTGGLPADPSHPRKNPPPRLQGGDFAITTAGFARPGRR